MGRPYKAQEEGERGEEMTVRHIHWCMVCNMVTVSKRCPICRNEVSRLDLLDDGILIPLSKAGMDKIRSYVDSTFGKGCGELLIPDNCISFVDRSDAVSDIIVNGGKVGHIADGKVLLDLTGLKVIKEKIAKNYIRCDHDSSYFVKKGRSLMVTGISESYNDLKKGDQVAVLDDRGGVIAAGVMKMSSEDMHGSERGVAVGIRSNVSSRTCYGVPPHDWKDTIMKSKPTVDSAVGTSVKAIRELTSSYGGDIVIRFNGDVRSEASMLLIIDAGYAPKVIVDGKDDFIDFMVERHGLTVVKDVPDRCLLLTDKVDGGLSSETVTHWPIREWEPSLVWTYLMVRREPFNRYYVDGSLIDVDKTA